MPIVAKRRATRKEKIIAKLRRELAYTKPETEVNAEKTVTAPIIPTSQPITTLISSQSYSYVIADIKKTAIVTTLILIGQLTAYFIFLR